MRMVMMPGAAAALALAAGPASAAGMAVTLGGYVHFQAGFFDYDQVTGGNDRDFKNEVEVHVKADGKTDTGLSYGVAIEMELQGTQFDSDGRTIRTDEASLYVGGAWGRLELGDQDGASDQLAIAAPTTVASVAGFTDDWGLPFENTDLFRVPDSSDSSKITYTTPTLYGLRAGISYAPEINEGDAVILTEPASQYGDWVEAGLQYRREVSGAAVTASLTGSGANGHGPLQDDFVAWQAGLRLTYAGFSVGGGYVGYGDFSPAVTVRRGDSPGVTLRGRADHAWNVGATYSDGAYEFGAAYTSLSYDGRAGVATGDVDYRSLTLDAGYVLTPGMTVHAGYAHATLDVAGLGDFDSDLFLLGTRLAF